MSNNVWITSDTHFGHKFMAEHRGFPDPATMDETLIEAWNYVVRPQDTVWHLGDFSFHGAERTADIFSRLHGHKNLVRGNHDSKHVERQPWTRVVDLHTLRFDGCKLVLCHYPFETWANAHHGALHLHGHSHGTMPQRRARYDVGVDTNLGYWPYHVADIIDRLHREGPYESVDHHG